MKTILRIIATAGEAIHDAVTSGCRWLLFWFLAALVIMGFASRARIEIDHVAKTSCISVKWE